MLSLYNKPNDILANEMGLGKTVQLILCLFLFYCYSKFVKLLTLL
jgi:SNF2 family DNA or RNA helicase